MIASVIKFDQQGEGHCLYTEAVDLSAIGSLQIARASNIEFNNQTQQWEVKTLKGTVLFFSKFRAVCLEWERANI